MATSPNYAWAEPDNSSLVKNGAADIRTLGDAIDTSVWNIGFGQAGKNKIINGNFGVWQRGTSFSTSGAWVFNADRFQGYMSSGTATLSQQTFTPGTAPVTGYESAFFIERLHLQVVEHFTLDNLLKMFVHLQTKQLLYLFGQRQVQRHR
jgi:hypothetical protein